MADPVIRHVSMFGGDVIDIPRASTTVFKRGWLVSIESNAAVNLNANTEDITFGGLAYTNHENGDALDLTLAMKTIADIAVTSATFTLGASVTYTAGSATVEYEVVASASNTIGQANKIYTAATTLLHCRFDAPDLQKLFVNGA